MADREPIVHQFMDLRVPEYAYMFGFLQADGNLYQGAGRKGRLTVEINAKDVQILRHFQKLTPYYSNITARTRCTNFAASHSSATWTLCSLEARTTLNELGLPYGRKSKTVAPPHGDFSPRDYLRGLIDADGSVGYTAKGFPFISLTTASTAIGTYLCRYAQQLTGAERNIKRNARDAIYNILYTKEKAQKLATELYYNGCLALERKKTTADTLNDWVRPAGMRVAPERRRWTAHEDRVLLGLNNDAAAAKDLGRTVPSCSVRLWRLRTGQARVPAE
ncbi:LAGLIDADG family homing endonuclease [Streptomyces sp. NPDC060053]|uniref:LAGLIDADG family homing endonuclease n=1 Tax=Streptomyces sp. NPDC060053 TaxID=3347047 RepID=UPI0036757FEF